MTAAPRKPRKKPAAKKRASSAKKSAVSAEVVAATPTSLALPDPPADLGAGAAAIWPELVADLERNNNLRNLEGVRMLAVAAARARAAAEQLETEGLLVATKDGHKPNPLLRIERESTTTFIRLAAEYGLTPESQMRLALAHLRGQAMVDAIGGAAAQRDEVAEMNASLELDDLDLDEL